MAANRAGTKAAGKQRAGARHAGHTLAGFTVGVVAVAAGFFLAGGGHDGHQPLSEAARHAEQVAAIRIALDPDARPEAVPPTTQEPVPFVDDAEGLALFSLRHATRVVIASVGVDTGVKPVGLVYRGGALQYDVPRIEAGQYVGSAAPGEAGNIVIGGHVAQRGAPGVFQELPRVTAGDVVEVYRGDHVYRYSITEIKVVAADATDVMSSTQEATLTLITCFPDDNYRERLVVVGRLM